MSLPLLLASLWVVAGTFVAFLPMRLQYPPGICLLLAAPCLLIWIGIDHGMWVALAGAFAFVSMFRRPLGYFVKRGLGLEKEVVE